MKRENLTAEIQLLVLIFVGHSAEEDCFYATSPRLGLVRDGDTPEEAVKILIEAVATLIDAGLRYDTLDKVLEGGGYEKHVNGDRIIYGLPEVSTEIFEEPAQDPEMSGTVEYMPELTVAVPVQHAVAQ